MLDHIVLTVSNIERSLVFYEADDRFDRWSKERHILKR
jgi:catechol 2,3-dioxygenase-like lactoylglutathione lyase family enzyme